jgi:DNA mismatch repair ATPase MutS
MCTYHHYSVARLAGLPEPVVMRAKTQAEEFERRLASAHRGANAAAAAAAAGVKIEPMDVDDDVAPPPSSSSSSDASVSKRALLHDVHSAIDDDDVARVRSLHQAMTV